MIPSDTDPSVTPSAATAASMPARCGRTLKPSTVLLYDKALRHFREVFGGELPCDRQTVERYIASMRKGSPSTAYLRVQAVRHAHLQLGQPAFGIQVRVEGVQLSTLGTIVSDAIDRGGVCGVQLQTDQGLRWVFVSGVELEGTEGNRVRALLLIDPDESPPWGAGYNVRLELQGTPARSDPGHEASSVYRTIHGRIGAVQPKGVLVVEPSGLQLPLYAAQQL